MFRRKSKPTPVMSYQRQIQTRIRSTIEVLMDYDYPLDYQIVLLRDLQHDIRTLDVLTRCAIPD